jgi:hypothetical protein
MNYAALLSGVGLIVGVIALMLSWLPNRCGRRWGFSKNVASTLSLVGMGLIFFALMLVAASAQR